LQGHFRILFLYDVAEAVNLDAIRSMLESRGVAPSVSLTLPIPQYMRFEKPPVVEPISSIALETGERLAGKTKYYDYGVVSI